MLIKLMTFFIAIFCCFTLTVDAANDVSGKIYVARTLVHINAYVCPLPDYQLFFNLKNFLHRPRLINVVCEANFDSKECLKGPLSLETELTGLANVVKAKNNSYCVMSTEDVAQLNYMLDKYLSK